MIKTIFFSSKPYDITSFKDAIKSFNTDIQMDFHSDSINVKNALLVKGYDAVCVFVNDAITPEIASILKDNGCKLIALRCAGYNNVDLQSLKEYGIPVIRVPEYSPYAVAEYAFALLLTLNRKIHKAHNRVRELNFNIDGLLGFDLHGKTMGVIGTGKIGKIFINIAKGFGMNIVAYDPYPDLEHAEKLNYKYLDLDELYKQSDIIALHCPLTKDTHHIINKDSVSKMKEGVVIINTSRGGLIDTQDIIQCLKGHKISALAIDVYEEEENVFFEDFSHKANITDDVLSRLMTFNNVIVTSHQAFFTKEALDNISKTTIDNILSYLQNNQLKNEVI